MATGDVVLRIRRQGGEVPAETARAFAALTTEIQRDVAALRAAGQAAGQSETQFLAAAGALSQQALAAGDATRAEQILAVALQKETSTAQQAAGADQQLTGALNQVKAAQDSTAKSSSGLSSAFTNLKQGAGALGIAFGTAQLVRTEVELFNLGAQSQRVDARFDSLAQAAGTTGTAIRQALQNASHGEVDRLSLELAANRAQLLGVAHDADTFSRLMAIARDRAQNLGTTTKEAFDDIVTGVGRTSPRILDNLGIIINEKRAYDDFARSLHKSADSLSDAERKQAILNAVLKQGEDTIRKTGGAVDDAASGSQRFAAAAEDIKAAYGQGFVATLGPAVNVLGRIARAGADAGADAGAASRAKAARDTADGFIALIPVFGLLSSGFKNLDDAAKASGPAFDDLRVKSQGSIADHEQLGSVLGAVTSLFTQANPAIAQYAQSMFVAAAGAREHNLELQQTPERMAQAALQQAVLGDQMTRGAEASQIDTAQKQAQAAVLELVTAQTQRAAEQFLTLNPNIDASGVAALVAAGKIDKSLGPIIEYAIRVRDARNALAAFNSEAGTPAQGGDAINRFLTGKQKSSAFTDTQADEAKKAHDRQTLALGTDKEKLRVLNEQAAAARRQFGAGSAQAIDAETKIGQAQARGAKSTDTAGRSRVSAAEKTLSLEERIADSQAKQVRAAVDAKLAILDDRKARLKENEELERAQKILGSPQFSQRFKERADIEAQRIPLEQQKRQLDINEKLATAGGTVRNGRIIQGQRGAVSAADLPPTSLGGPPPGATTSATGGGPTSEGQLLTLILTTDSGQILAKTVEPFIMDELLRGARTARARVGA